MRGTSWVLGAAVVAGCAWAPPAWALCAAGDDSDDDSIFDLDEDRNGNGDCDDDDTDGDGIPDYLDEDDDGDGLSTLLEGDRDVERGPVGEGSCEDWGPDAPCVYCLEPAPDGVPNYLDLDSDGDGKPDAEEHGDMDNDAIIDAYDCYDCDGPAVDLDCDADGLPSSAERRHGADDHDPDVDGDGLADGCEATGDRAPDTDGDGSPDLFDPDNDGDGLNSAFEGGNRLRPRVCLTEALPDSDRDGVANAFDPDDDGDGVWTRFEQCDPDGDGQPTDARDTDSDGQHDYLDGDDDGDGCPTRDEGADPDGDGDPRDALDTDGDGIVDWLDGDCGDEETDDTDRPVDTGDSDPPADTGRPVDDEGVRGSCGCASGSGAVPAWVGVLALGLLVMRRRETRR